MITWPGDPSVSIEPSSLIAKGKPANVSQIHMGSHTGTHVDPPLHFLENGGPVDMLDLNVLVGKALVLDMEHAGDAIETHHLEAAGLSEGTERVLFKTPNSKIWSGPAVFPDRYTALSPEAAEWLVGRGVRLVGIDFLSIERRGAAGHPTHHTLLDAGVVIVEGLDLSQTNPGEYWLTCLPLKILGGDGAPARAILSPLR